MKFFFDENFSHRLIKGLHCLVEYEGDHAEHTVDRGWRGMPDEEWHSKLADEGDWIIVTNNIHIASDPHYIEGRRMGRLVTVLFRPGWQDLGFWGIAWRLLKFWPNLKGTLAQTHPGSVVEFTVNGRTQFKAPPG